jgi:hypothetical protein
VIGRLDRDPGNGLACIGVAQEVERDLRGEAVEGDSLDHAVGGKRQA